MIQGTDDYDMVLEIKLNSDNSTRNNYIVGDNEWPMAVVFTSCLRESKVFMIQM